jgi:hypothetical protein
VFRFAAAGSKPSGFECSLDAAPFTACKSPADFGQLGPGEHVFNVRALSPGGNPDTSPASYRWTVFEDLVPGSQTQPQPLPQAKAKPKAQSPPPQNPPQLVG